MAKKKRRVSAKQEEEYEFVPPEFDEKEFILEDLYGTKVLLVTFALAIIVGILAGIMDRAWEFGVYLGALLMILAAVALKEFLKLLRFNPDLLEAKSMLGNYAMFIFLSLGIWILTINAPFV